MALFIAALFADTTLEWVVRIAIVDALVTNCISAVGESVPD
jgi:hypothetical protein